MICIAECEIPIGDRAFLGIAKSVVGLQNSTGSYRRETLIENALFMGTFEIPKSYIQKAAKLYYGEHRRFRFPEKLEFKLFLV